MMAFKNNYSNVGAKPTFAANFDSISAGNYIKRKTARTIVCNSFDCNLSARGLTQGQFLILKQTRYLTGKKPYVNLSLNSNLFTKMNLEQICVIKSLASNTCPNTKVNPSLDFYNNYVIDPNGSLFGNSPCGIDNYLNYREPSEIISSLYSGSGFTVQIGGNDDIYYIFTFNSDGYVYFYQEDITVNYIIVGGGGGGGGGVNAAGGAGGGGGGGEVQYGTLNNAYNPFFYIKIGDGGSPGTTTNNGISNTLTDGGDGGTTSVTGSINIDSIGGSGGKKGGSNGGDGGNSGSGGAGGAGGTVGSVNGGAGTNGSGGGGGNYSGSGVGGNGANISLANPSFMSTINQYGAGGGGGTGNGNTTQSNGGNNAGQGGVGLPGMANGKNAIANYGGGGGGGCSGNASAGTSGNGGSGSSGIVLLYIKF